MKLLFLGHASFRLTLASGAVIYIDPFCKGDYSAKADLVLVTHEHYDHNRVDLVTLKAGGKILRANDFVGGKPVRLLGANIEAVPAYNKNHKEGCVGYVIECEGLRLYFAGDTSTTKFMESMSGIDYAFLPTDGIFNMDAEEATKCAELIGAKFSVPVHTERPEERFDESVVSRFTPRGKLVIRPGSEITL